jgi:hypothetical protein
MMMFDFFKKPKEEKDVLVEEVISRIKHFHKANKFKSKIVLEYLLTAYQSEDSIEEFYKTIYLGKDKLAKAEDMHHILNMKSVLNEKKFVHWNNGKTYITLGIALPVDEVLTGNFNEIFHTEEERYIPIYMYGKHYYHNRNNEVLVIYLCEDKMYARPYEMFFGLVEDNGVMKPRFKKI